MSPGGYWFKTVTVINGNLIVLISGVCTCREANETLMSWVDTHTEPSRAMEAVDKTLKCPVCQDFFIDPVTLQCGHDFCLTCIQAVWETDLSPAGPFFCPECQIFLPSDLTLEINTGLQRKVKNFTANRQLGSAPAAVHCDHCIEQPSEAVRTCLTCDASLCPAHASLHEQKSAFREHTLVEVTRDPLSLKCREHRDELKLFCMEEKVPVCCLCALVGRHKHHRMSQLHEAGAEFRVTTSSVNAF